MKIHQFKFIQTALALILSRICTEGTQEFPVSEFDLKLSSLCLGSKDMHIYINLLLHGQLLRSPSSGSDTI